MISLIGASRGRPKAMQGVIDRALQLASPLVPIEVIIRLDIDDPSFWDYPLEDGYYGGDRLGMGVAQPTQEAATYAKGEIIMHVADDQEFVSPNWNKTLFAANEDRPLAFSINEGRKQMEHPIVNRAWLNLVGHFYPPGLKHLFCDTYIEKLAKESGCLKRVPITILHHKFSQQDTTFKESRDASWQDAAIFKSLPFDSIIEKLRGSHAHQE